MGACCPFAKAISVKRIYSSVRKQTLAKSAGLALLHSQSRATRKLIRSRSSVVGSECSSPVACGLISSNLVSGQPPDCRLSDDDWRSQPISCLRAANPFAIFLRHIRRYKLRSLLGIARSSNCTRNEVYALSFFSVFLGRQQRGPKKVRALTALRTKPSALINFLPDRKASTTLR